MGAAKSLWRSDPLYFAMLWCLLCGRMPWVHIRIKSASDLVAIWFVLCDLESRDVTAISNCCDGDYLCDLRLKRGPLRIDLNLLLHRDQFRSGKTDPVQFKRRLNYLNRALFAYKNGRFASSFLLLGIGLCKPQKMQICLSKVPPPNPFKLDRVSFCTPNQSDSQEKSLGDKRAVS